MAKLKLNHIYKVYENGVKAVNDLSIDIEDKEFIVFVGPSGCGKSTTLRMIAGLEEISAGDLYIGDTLMNDMEPKDRDIAMVFQNYALYPHMSVYENMAFGLRNRKVPNEVIKERVIEAARILDIEDYLDRKPKEMSGGQRQRVALGRAIVRQPKVFLLDEPLSNLDAKLRAVMRTEITKLHKKLQTTFIYVTHDQVEAMTMGTRIVVMRKGFVQQIDTPTNLYQAPINKFVAGFIGTPQMNFFRTFLLKEEDSVHMILANMQHIFIPLQTIAKVERRVLDGKTPLIFGIRPEDLHLERTNENLKITILITDMEELGSETLIYGELIGTLHGENQEAEDTIIIKASSKRRYEIGTEIEVYIDETRIHLFDAETEMTVLPAIPKMSYVSASVSENKMKIEGQTIDLPPAILEKVNHEKEVTIGIENQALVPGTTFHFKVLLDEKILGKRLLHLKGKNDVLFVEVKDDLKVGKVFDCDLDMSKIEIQKENQTLLAPVRFQDSLTGKIIKIKEKDETGKKKTNFYFAFNSYRIKIPLEIITKLTIALDRKIYQHALRFEFDIHHLQIAEEGILGHIEKINDYGTICLAQVRLEEGEKSVNVIVDRNIKEKEIHLLIQPERCSIYDATNNVRII